MESTPPKTNMEPENELHEEEIPIKNSSFLGSILVFGGVRVFFFRWLHLFHGVPPTGGSVKESNGSLRREPPWRSPCVSKPKGRRLTDLHTKKKGCVSWDMQRRNAMPGWNLDLEENFPWFCKWFP